MRNGSSNAKGAAFEREICVSLSKWLTEGKRQDLFWRSAMSGGRATVAFKRGERLDRQAGDICAIDPEGHALTDKYYFELKCRRAPGLESFLLNNKGPLADWWRKTCHEAKRHDRIPVLIFKGNRMPILVVTEEPLTINPEPTIRTDLGVIGMFEEVLKCRPSKLPKSKS